MNETIAHYRDLRALSYSLVEAEFPQLHLNLSEISLQDAQAGDAWQSQWADPRRAAEWSWVRLFHDYRSHSGIKRFDMAVKVGGKLCGLAYGVPNKSRIVLKIHAIGRAPIDNPLRGSFFRIVLFAAVTYARFIGSDELWLVNPVNEDVAAYYGRFGFSSERSRGGSITHMRLKVPGA